MRKIFTLISAVLASVSLWAATETNPAPGDVTADQAIVGISYIVDGSLVAGGGNTKVGAMPDKGVKFRLKQKIGDYQNALEFQVNEGYAIEGIQLIGVTNKAGETAHVTTIYVDGTAWNGTFEGTLPAKDASEASNIVVSNIDARESVVFVFDGGSSQSNICYVVTYEEATPSTEPVLRTDATSIEFEVTAASPELSETITFAGKNLTPGEYALTMPNVAGLSIEPAAVTVGADGKLNEEVIVTYTSEVDVPKDSTIISLTISEQTVEVKIFYSAEMAKNYISKSLNIEQVVLDNGKGYDIAAALDEANIDFDNINELDSLNDAKPNRNEPYLGLKLKTEGASIGCWVKAGDSIAVKFGYVDTKVLAFSPEGTYELIADENHHVEVLKYYNPEADTYIVFATPTAKTVVVKQIMLNEPIAEVTLPESPEAIDQVNADTKAVKRIVNGQLVIIRGDKMFDMTGAMIE